MNYDNVYFIGIGGIGMSALARFCKFKGCSVSGYDRTPSELTHQLETEGIDVHYNDDSSRIPADVQARIFSYHFDDPAADFHSANLRLDDSGHYIYDLVYPGGTLSDIRAGAIGWVNVENSIAAAAACLCYGMDAQKVRHAVASFEGVRRRLDVHVNRPGLCYIDDYAHHPAELRSAISSVRQVFPGRKITGVFQPHLYTRTRDFAPEFAEALSLLDKLVLLDIYPAREEPIEGVSSALIFKDVNCPEKVMITKSELMDFLADENIDVLMTLGAGDIDRFVPQITDMLEKR